MDTRRRRSGGPGHAKRGTRRKVHRQQRGRLACFFLIAAVVAGVLFGMAADPFRGRLHADLTADTVGGSGLAAGTVNGKSALIHEPVVPDKPTGTIDATTNSQLSVAPRMMTIEDARVLIPARTQRLSQRHERWLVSRLDAPPQSAELPELPPELALPPLPDEPGGEIDRERMGDVQ
jgi:hypothetical protein